MSEWQPIETAPKDKSIILGEYEGWVMEGQWDEDDENWYAANNDSTDAWGGPLYPTHWMPLPEPPK